METRRTRPKPSNKLGLRLEAAHGETAISTLSSLGLIERESRPVHTKHTLTIPLARMPSEFEMAELRKKLGTVSLVKKGFKLRNNRPHSLEEALSLLPPEAVVELPRAFDIVGDIAILELTPELEVYQSLIAEAVMTVQKNVKAVFAKAGPVSGAERTRPLKHLAGEERTVTIHKEFGARFKVDIAKAYYNPRLSTEHRRVASQVSEEEQVVDMFAGVGPFAILIAKNLSKVKVDAIDLNPEATRLLEENIQLNKVSEKVKAWTGDARDVVDKEIHEIATRVVMNHPSQSRGFVQSAVQALRPQGGMIHYYTFIEGLEAEANAVRELEDTLESVDWNIEETLLARKVRGIAPGSWLVVVDCQVAPA